jgi:hypothetical protein
VDLVVVVVVVDVVVVIIVVIVVFVAAVVVVVGGGCFTNQIALKGVLPFDCTAEWTRAFCRYRGQTGCCFFVVIMMSVTGHPPWNMRTAKAILHVVEGRC